MKPANYAPVYAALYPGLTEIFRKHGYALCIHGSLARDFDVVAVPWVKEVSDPQVILEEIVEIYSVKLIGEPETREHGRRVYTLSIGFGQCFVDLSFMPKVSP